MLAQLADCEGHDAGPFETAITFHDGSTGLNQYPCTLRQPARHPCCRYFSRDGGSYMFIKYKPISL
jgi:hypothetical protein